LDKQTKEEEMGWAYGTFGGGENAYKVLVRKWEGESPLGRHKHR
jgi:hypothetical protein